MSGIPSALQGAHGGGAAGLASQLSAIANDADAAATFADGEYIPQMSREHELRRAFSGAGRAAALLEELRPRIAKLEGGDDGLRLAQHAIDNLEGGRQALLDGVVEVQDASGHGTVVADAIATGTAGGMFRDAATRVRDIADVATLESVPAEDLYDAITRSAR